MTREEFNCFLQPLGLIWSWTNMPIQDCNKFEISPGWYRITADLISTLIALGWNKRLYQVKMKYGAGRFYIEENTDLTFREKIQDWEHQTLITCTRCGGIKESERRNSLCDDCKDLYLEKIFG